MDTEKTFGRYEIIEQLGEGGMALVYKAYDTHLDTFVALKVIRQDWLSLESSGSLLARFEAEAKRVARLSHPNIIPILDYGKNKDVPYLVMKYLSGGTLKERLGRPMACRAAAHLLVPIARALSYAHQQGLVHRDVKPANILLTETGEPMLADFGLAKILFTEKTRVDITGSAVVIGTPEYMAPEQALGKPVDARADIYSLGLIFYEMVTGRKPFTADTPMAVAMKHITQPLPPPRQFIPGLPALAEQTILRALAKEPEDRFPSAAAFCEALERLAAGESLPPVRPEAAAPPARPAVPEAQPARSKPAQVAAEPPRSTPPQAAPVRPASNPPAAGLPAQAEIASRRAPALAALGVSGVIVLACLAVAGAAALLIGLPALNKTRTPVAAVPTRSAPAPTGVFTRPAPTAAETTAPVDTQPAGGQAETPAVDAQATERAYNRSARTATAGVRATEQAQGLYAVVLDLQQKGVVSRAGGTYHPVDDFNQSWAQLLWYQYWPTDYSPSNFVISAHTEWESASRVADWYASGCGFVFREKDEENHYLIYLALDGNVYLKAYVEGQFYELGKEFYGQVDFMQDQADVLLAVDGARITYFINGEQAFQRENQQLDSGGLFLTLVSGTNKDFGTRCRMTDVELWAIDE
jgi:hypothetical protein